MPKACPACDPAGGLCAECRAADVFSIIGSDLLGGESGAASGVALFGVQVDRTRVFAKAAEPPVDETVLEVPRRARQPEASAHDAALRGGFDAYVAGELGRVEAARHQLVDLEARAQAAITARHADLDRREAEVAARRADLDRRDAESGTFAQFMQGEFAKLARARHLLVEIESRAQAEMVARQVESGRREAELVAAEKACEARSAGLDADAEALAAHQARAEARSAELAAREVAVAELEARRDSLRAEAADLANLASELRPLVERLELRRDEALRQHAELDARRAAIDRRLVEVGRAELSLQRRLDELERFENATRAELEARDLELLRRERAAEEEVASVRGAATVPM